MSQAKNGVRDVEDQAAIEINSRFRTLAEKRALLNVVAMSQNTAREKLRVKNQFQIQSALLTDVLRLRAELADADDRYQQALIGFWTAKADFEQAVGEEVARVEDTAKPDVLVAYHASFGRDLQINAFGMGWGPIAGRSGTARVEEVTVGTLAIDIVDANSRTIVWRAMGSKDIDPNANPDKRDRNIDKAAEKLFRNYPPKP